MPSDTSKEEKKDTSPLILDDPYIAEDVTDNPEIRKKINDWFQSTYEKEWALEQQRKYVESLEEKIAVLIRENEAQAEKIRKMRKEGGHFRKYHLLLNPLDPEVVCGRAYTIGMKVKHNTRDFMLSDIVRCKNCTRHRPMHSTTGATPVGAAAEPLDSGDRIFPCCGYVMSRHEYNQFKYQPQCPRCTKDPDRKFFT